MHKRRAQLRAAQERFWVLPAISILVAMVAGLFVPTIDRAVALPEWFAMSGQMETARTVLAAIVALGVSVAGVSFSVIAVALVLASQQLSPRVLQSFQRQPLNQGVLAVLLATATYSLFVLGSVSEEPDRPVPELAVTLAMVLAAGSLALFVVFLHHAIRSLNASAVIRRIAVEGHESIAAPYPAGVGQEPEDAAAAEEAVETWSRLPCCVEVRARRAGYIASVDGASIVEWARSAGAFVEQRRGIGTFAVTGAALATIHAERELEPGTVHDAFLLREERIVDGDVAFPIRQLTDIALKGLSPGMNDPTTAENAMDSTTDTLVRFAQRPAVAPVRADADGVPRLRAITPTLDDLVLLAFDQVRRHAAGRPSFALRLLELLADLRESAPAARPCREIDRQAELIAAQAAELVNHEADQRMVAETYERLHAARRHPSRRATTMTS